MPRNAPPPIVLPEHTSDPSVVRFLLGGPDVDPVGGSHAERLCARLLALDGVDRAVLTAQGRAVEVAKRAAADWRELGARIVESLEAWLADEPSCGRDGERDGSSPGARAVSDLELHVRVLRVLEVEVAPYVASHGGEIELLDVRDGRAQVRLRGACKDCPGSAATLRDLVSERVRRAVPEISAVEVGS